MHPQFPQFRPIEGIDRESIRQLLWEYQPQTSEWTFTNLFIWRSRYGFQWSIYKDWLVIIAKASPEIPGHYRMINQQFCEKSWPHVPSINREQDLGELGLRQAKLSYYPDHLVEKFQMGLR